MSVERRGLDRRSLLRGVGVMSLLGMSGIPYACDTASVPDDQEPAIFDLSFHVQNQYRPFALVAAGFEDIDEAGPQTVRSLTITGHGPVAPFAAVELRVEAADDADVVAGLFGARDDHVAVVFSPSRQEASIEVRGHDGHTDVVARAKVQLPTQFGAAFVLCENQVTALVDTGDGWRPVVTNRDQVADLIDLRQPGTLSALTFGYGTTSATGTVELSRVRAGAFGMVGLRDPHLVQRPDGSAYVREGKIYLTFTCAGLGFFQQAHWGVFTLDLDDPTKLEQVAQLYSQRDGLLLGDHAGQIVVDEANGRFIVLTSSWGDFDFDGVHVRHATTSDDLLSGVHVLETERLDLPTKVSSWDPAATLIGDSWHIAFVESPSQNPFDFHPALSVGPPGGAYNESLELVGADTSVHQCEGPILQQVQGQWYLLASDSDVGQYRVYDLSVTLLGELDAPYGTNIPHPQLVERQDGAYLMVTFDGTQYAENLLGYGGHGDVVIMSSRPD